MLDVDVGHAGFAQVVGRHRGQVFEVLEAAHVLRQTPKTRTDEPAAGTDFQYRICRGEFKRLHQTRLDRRSQHDLLVTQGHFRIGKRQLGETWGNELLPWNRFERCKHIWVEDLPGAQLLGQHLLTRMLDIHRPTSRHALVGCQKHREKRMAPEGYGLRRAVTSAGARCMMQARFLLVFPRRRSPS